MASLRRGVLTVSFFPAGISMQDWTYESLIKSLKVALAEVEASAEAPSSDQSQEAENRDASSPDGRAITLRAVRRASKG